ncbi:MAG: hypothetical protein WC326_04585 [Candidatus Delongbacteria bacterium]
MSKLILLSLVLASWSGTVLAAGDESPERRVDTETYQMLAPTQPASGGSVDAQAVAGRAQQAQADGPLAELRSRHQSEYAALLQTLAGARDNAERDALELQASQLKARQAREELEWLRSEAVLKGNTSAVDRLDAALLDLQPKTAPVATSFVPRDTVTGVALDGRTGGAK